MTVKECVSRTNISPTILDMQAYLRKVQHLQKLQTEIITVVR